MPKLEWEEISPGGLRSPTQAIVRTPIPGGWLLSGFTGGLVFVPDPQHRWDGGSVPKWERPRTSPPVAKGWTRDHALSNAKRRIEP